MSVRCFCYSLPAVLALVLMATAVRGTEAVTNRLAQIEEQIAQTKTLLADTTNDLERTHWQQSLELLQQDRQNLQRRMALDEKEHQLTVRQQRQTNYRLQEMLRAISTDVSMPSNEVARSEYAIQSLQLQRNETEQARQSLAGAGQTNAEQIAELDQQLRVLDEETAARSAERDAAEARVHLVSEARRIEEAQRNAAINPQVTLRLLREQQRQLNAAAKGRTDAAEVVALYQLRREGISAALALSQEKVAHLEAEQALFNKKNQGVKGWFKTLPLFFSSNAEKKYLSQRLQAQQQQLTAVEASIGLTTQLHDLLDLDTAHLQEEHATLLNRFEQRLLIPAGTIVVLLIGYLLFSRILTPRLLTKERQASSRRLAGYLCVFLGLLELVLFFFEDLRSVATILGIASAAVVIALQDMCSAFAGWFVIMLGRKFAVGQRVEIDGTRGDVIDIQLLRTTLLEVNNGLGVDEPTGRIIVVPNSFVFKSKYFNYSYLHPFVWTKLDITVTYETPASEAQALLLRALEEETRDEFAAARTAAGAMEQHYGVPDANYQPKIYSFIADSGVLFRLIYCSHYKRISSTRNRVNTRIIQEFEKNPRLQFAYPTERHIPTPEKGGFHVALEHPN